MVAGKPRAWRMAWAEGARGESARARGCAAVVVAAFRREKDQQCGVVRNVEVPVEGKSTTFDPVSK